MKERPLFISRSGELIFVERSLLQLRGRVQSVITSTESPWAVRNVKNVSRGLKTEPHIEAGHGFASENLFKFCYQGNIESHIKSDERFLFLMTVCRNPDFPEKFGKRLINGYIDKRGYGYQESPNGKRFFVFGSSFVVGFEHAISVETLGYNPYIRVQLIDEDRTSMILSKFADFPNETPQYVNEVQKLDPTGKTCVLTAGMPCIFKNTCLRNKPSEK